DARALRRSRRLVRVRPPRRAGRPGHGFAVARKRARPAARRRLRNRLPHGAVRRGGLVGHRRRSVRRPASARTSARPGGRPCTRGGAALRRRRVRCRRFALDAHRRRRFRGRLPGDRACPESRRAVRLRRHASVLRRPALAVRRRGGRPRASPRLVPPRRSLRGRARGHAARPACAGRRDAPPAREVPAGVPRRRPRARARGGTGLPRLSDRDRPPVPPVSVAPVALWDELLRGEELAHVETVPSAAAQLAPLPAELDPRVRAALDAKGLDSLYVHQALAWEAAARGENVIVTTGTASGKTLAFNLPVLDALAREPKTRALYLYPTKALAQDQARSLTALRVPRVRAAIYDGDTPTERRWQIRRWANLVLTNPDMLHVGVLPHHDRWGDVLANLRYVVVDEAHVYRGVFGSHVANVLRRLRRIARVYGSDPQFLLASATIANPGELARSLLGAEATVVDEDAAPRAERTIALWNPPLVDPELGLRASTLGEASRLYAALVSGGLRTICFAKSRKAAELVHRFTVERVERDVAERLAPYRAGYTPAQRRDIERRLVEGELLGVSATDALELGIDIGLLDCAISVGFPGTVASLRQQWGRAGRRGHGLAVLVASEDALDQYFMRRPETLLERRVEAAILDHANVRVLDGHVRAAAYEAPLDDADRATLGDVALERAAVLPELQWTPAGFVWSGRDYPAARVPLRSTSPEAFTVVDVGTGTVLGLVERERAYSTVHEGAVYLHLGESYLVRELDLGARRALVEPFRGNWYTQTKKETTTAIEETLRGERRLGLDAAFGRVVVTEQVVAYQRKAIGDGSTLETCPLELPETTFETE
ncbi:MAG: DEAD/DEAH box helicase, partial [Actinobacteria bacterium]